MAGVTSMTVAINPADKNLIVVIVILLWMRRAKTFGFKIRFRILNWLLTCAGHWVRLVERVFSRAQWTGAAFGNERAPHAALKQGEELLL
jgi:hypothetical protein